MNRLKVRTLISPLTRGMKNPFLGSCALVAVVIGACLAPAYGQTTNLQEKFGDARLLYCFQGKGSFLPYDAGVLHESFARIPSLRNRQVIVSGNSSGSIMAAYFSVFGFTETSVRYAEYRLIHGDRSAIRQMEAGQSKALKLLKREKTEISHENLREYMGFALGVPDWQSAGGLEEIIRRSRAKPNFPVIIIAANKEVLQERVGAELLTSYRYKTFDPHTGDVFWKPEVYEFYRRNPAKFAQQHPDLRLGDTPRIGKALTYFVDQSMFDLLSQIPEDERLADLRLMKDAQDLGMGILASVSEPTYFEPVAERRPELLAVNGRLGYLGNSARRVYCGGYLVSLPAQDVRRMLPGIRTMGTGWIHNPLVAQKLLEAWYGAPVETYARIQDGWADLQVNPERSWLPHIIAKDLSAQEEFEGGRRTAEKCLNLDRGLPPYIVQAKNSSAAKNAIWPNDSVASPPGAALPTLRGLGELISRQ